MKKAALIIAGGWVATVLAGLVLGAEGIDGAAWLGEHNAWYASRAAGFASYLLLWASLVGGLLMSSAWLDGVVNRGRLNAIHQTSGIAGLVLGTVHGLALIPDGWTSYTIVNVLVPFTYSTERGLTGLGTVSFYLFAMVGLSFWFRTLIGPRMWKLIHWAGFVAFAGALWHGIALGSDTREVWAMWIYATTGLAVVFSTVIRVTFLKERPQRAAEVQRDHAAAG